MADNIQKPTRAELEEARHTPSTSTPTRRHCRAPRRRPPVRRPRRGHRPRPPSSAATDTRAPSRGPALHTRSAGPRSFGPRRGLETVAAQPPRPPRPHGWSRKRASACLDHPDLTGGRGRRAAPVSRPGERGASRGLQTVAAQPPHHPGSDAGPSPVALGTPPASVRVVEEGAPAPVSRPGDPAADGGSEGGAGPPLREGQVPSRRSRSRRSSDGRCRRTRRRRRWRSSGRATRRRRCSCRCSRGWTFALPWLGTDQGAAWMNSPE